MISKSTKNKIPILLIFFILISFTSDKEIFNKIEFKNFTKSTSKISRQLPRIITTFISNTSRKYEIFKITAYDLNYESCQKSPGDVGYGMTRYGINLTGHDYKSIQVIAGDPQLFSFGTEIEIKFEDDWRQKYNGIYMIGDTGGGVKGNHFDLFLGENFRSECYDFGIGYAKIRVIK